MQRGKKDEEREDDRYRWNFNGGIYLWKQRNKERGGRFVNKGMGGEEDTGEIKAKYCGPHTQKGGSKQKRKLQRGIALVCVVQGICENFKRKIGKKGGGKGTNTGKPNGI